MQTWSQIVLKMSVCGYRRPWKTQKSMVSEEFCAFCGSHTFVPVHLGSARNKLHLHTVLRELKLFLSMQVNAWTVFPLSLSGNWWSKYFIPYRTKQMDPRESHGEKPSAIVKPNMHNPIPIKHTNVIPTNIDHILSNTKNSDCSVVLHVFEDNWDGNQNDYQRSKLHIEACFTDHTELLWIGCLTGLIWTQKFKSVTITPNTNSQTC